MKTLKFQKYHGLGNDFIIIEPEFNQYFLALTRSNKNIIKDLCSRNFGIGADGIILCLPSSKEVDCEAIIFNSDASEAEMCGNGIRCLAKFINDRSSKVNNLVVDTKAGFININCLGTSSYKVDMGIPCFSEELIPVLMKKNSFGIPSFSKKINNIEFDLFSVGMGNPHCVTYVKDFNTFDFNIIGPILEKDLLFPNKTNVHFARIKGRDEIEVKVWERGCGPTLACGTGACAVMAISYKMNKVNKEVSIILPGGTLNISWPDISSSIYMAGPAHLVYEGSFNI